MSNPFSFKEFTVLQFNSAFKVGTDSVLLGAWVNLENATRILDLGTGTGILSLMCAQRNSMAAIMALEPDKLSFREACQNFLESPWSDRLKAADTSLEEFRPETTFDYFICNPPFFADALISPDSRKTSARHLSHGWLELLASKVNSWGCHSAVFGVILPEKEAEILNVCMNHQQWFLRSVNKVFPFPNGQKVRILCEWGRSIPSKIEYSEMCIRNENREFSEEYKKLTRDFYLKF